MRRFLFVLVFLSSCTHAATEITWDAPTERLDGTPFYISEIDQFEINLTCPAMNVDFISQNNVFVIPQDVTGECQAKVLVVDTDGLRSDYSNIIDLTLKAVPKSPFNLRIF